MAAESEEFERAWAEIVADLTADDDVGLARLARGEDSIDGVEESAQQPFGGTRADLERNAGVDRDGSLGRDSDETGQTDTSRGPEPARDSDPGQDADPSRSAPGVQFPSVRPPGAPESGVARNSDPAAFVDGWSDEGHFTPPPPPELPAGSPATRLGWAGALGGIATLVVVTLTGWPVPRIVMWAAGLATLAGFVTLVWQLPDSRDDGWDDGAQV